MISVLKDHVYATGKRKSAIARVYLQKGAGSIFINDRSMEEYLGRPTDRMIVTQPLELTNQVKNFDVVVHCVGGGTTGQAGAIKHGISKALCLVHPELRPTLKKHGFLTRDARIKERKKYGQPSARA